LDLGRLVEPALRRARYLGRRVVHRLKHQAHEVEDAPSVGGIHLIHEITMGHGVPVAADFVGRLYVWAMRFAGRPLIDLLTDRAVLDAFVLQHGLDHRTRAQTGHPERFDAKAAMYLGGGLGDVLRNVRVTAPLRLPQNTVHGFDQRSSGLRPAPTTLCNRHFTFSIRSVTSARAGAASPTGHSA
jgi:hypothetical protein